jgi:hypothetical protein
VVPHRPRRATRVVCDTLLNRLIKAALEEINHVTRLARTDRSPGAEPTPVKAPGTGQLGWSVSLPPCQHGTRDIPSPACLGDGGARARRGRSPASRRRAEGSSIGTCKIGPVAAPRRPRVGGPAHGQPAAAAGLRGVLAGVVFFRFCSRLVVRSPPGAVRGAPARLVNGRRPTVMSAAEGWPAYCSR